MHLLRRVARVHRHVGAAVHDQVVPEDERHRVAAARRRANRAGAELAPVALSDDCAIEAGAEHGWAVLHDQLAQVGDDLGLP